VAAEVQTQTVERPQHIRVVLVVLVEEAHRVVMQPLVVQELLVKEIMVVMVVLRDQAAVAAQVPQEQMEDQVMVVQV
jgi:hypothetical protein